MKTCNDECYAAVAKKLNVSEAEVKEVIEHFLSFMDVKVREGKFEGMRLPYMGVITPRLDYIQNWFEQQGEK